MTESLDGFPPTLKLRLKTFRVVGAGAGVATGVELVPELPPHAGSKRAINAQTT